MNVHGYTKQKRVRIKTGWEDAGKQGWCYGYLNLEQCWAVIRWDIDCDPTLHKTEGLEEQASTWRDLV